MSVQDEFFDKEEYCLNLALTFAIPLFRDLTLGSVI